MLRSSTRLMAGAVLAGLLFTGSAKAALVLTLTELSGPHAGATYTQTDPTNTAVIDVTPFASGDFSTNIDIGSSDLNTGVTQASLQIQYLNITSNVAGPVSLEISLSDNGFTFPGVPGDLLTLGSSASATLTNSKTGDTLTFQSQAYDGINTYTDPLQSLTVTNGSTGTQALPTNNVSTSFYWDSAASAYSLADAATLNFSQAFEQENFNGTTVTTLSTTAVPEPVSAILLAPVMLLLGRRKRNRA
jgi:hypothetical protein